jgi:hypothetical protein
MSHEEAGQRHFIRERGRWLVTPLFLVVLVLETTDLVLAVDSIPAVFGVTRDPFLVYSSNVCAILGLRAFYFLLAGILPYFRYLDEGLAIILMFIGGKMLAETWVHITTGISLAIVGGVIAAAVIISVVAAKIVARKKPKLQYRGRLRSLPQPTPGYIHQLADSDPERRAQVASDLFGSGNRRMLRWFPEWLENQEFRALVVHEPSEQPHGENIQSAKVTVGIAVLPDTFSKIRAANGSPPLADAPADQDVLEFELHFPGHVQLDILTTKTPGGAGAIARFLDKFGEGIQQIEIDVTDVDRATEILRTQFKLDSIYPATRAGANGTRVNFFLVTASNGKKVLVELVEQPNRSK